MKLFLSILSACMALTLPALAQSSLRLDVYNGTTFGEVSVPLGNNSLLGFGATGEPVRITIGAGLTQSGTTLSASGAGAWADITGKPSTFPPSAHDQAWSTITGTPTTLSGYGITDGITAAAAAAAYAPLNHTQAISTIIGLQDDLNSRMSLAPNQINLTDSSTDFSIQLEPPGGMTFTKIVSFPDEEGQVVLTTATQTLTGKTLSGAQNSITGLNASSISAGIFARARLGSGTADATTYLRGDGTWATVAGGGVTSITGTANQITVTGTTTPTLSLPATITGLSSVTSTTFVGALTGTASGNVSSITGTANELTVTGTTTPTLSLPAALTFTGKTVTGGTFASPTLTTPRFANNGFIADANGNEHLILTTTASAVNELTLANASTGNNPTFTASGGDANIGETHTMKGTGSFTVRAGGSGNSQRWLNSVGSEVAYMRSDGWFVTNFGLGFANFYTTAGGVCGSTTVFASANGLQVNSLNIGGPVGITISQALSGAGAVNVTTSVTKFTSTGAAQALTLANGTDGQIKILIHVVDGGSGVLTPTTKTGFTSINFTNAGDTATLLFNTTIGWTIVASYGATITP